MNNIIFIAFFVVRHLLEMLNHSNIIETFLCCLQSSSLWIPLKKNLTVIYCNFLCIGVYVQRHEKEKDWEVGGKIPLGNQAEVPCKCKW